jgi:hypothetical protein
MVLGVAGRDRLVVAKGRAAQLDTGPCQQDWPSSASSMSSTNVIPLPSSLLLPAGPPAAYPLSPETGTANRRSA